PGRAWSESPRRGQTGGKHRAGRAVVADRVDRGQLAVQAVLENGESEKEVEGDWARQDLGESAQADTCAGGSGVFVAVGKVGVTDLLRSRRRLVGVASAHAQLETLARQRQPFGGQARNGDIVKVGGRKSGSGRRYRKTVGELADVELEGKARGG